MLGQLSTVVLPVGSARRAQAVAVARRLGLHGGAATGDYQRWIEAIEHRTFSPWPPSSPDLAARISEVSFVVTVTATATTTPRLVERTVAALQGQIHEHWSAVIDGPLPQACASTVARLQRAERRLQSRNNATLNRQQTPMLYDIDIAAGDILSPHALYEVARCVGEAQISDDVAPIVVTGDFDTISAGGDHRVDPVRSPGPDPDAALQFDLLGAFVARQHDVTIGQARHAMAQTSTTQARHLPLVLLHRRAATGPRVVQLPNATPEMIAAVSPETTVGPPAPQFGTRVRHVVPGTTRIGVVIRDRLGASAGEHQRHDLLRLIDMCNQSETSVRVELLPNDLTGSIDLGHFVLSCREAAIDTLMVIDGSLRLNDPDVFVDLLGVLLRPGVLGVAPIVTTPSGLVADAGLFRASGVWAARCGSLQRLPFELQTTRTVDAFSGRAFLVRVDDVERFSKVGFTPHGFAHVAAATGRRLVMWPHQRAVVEYGFDGGAGAAPAVTPWQSGRLAYWFGPGIPGYRPLNDSRSESVW
jgi:hypothetical protein